MLFAVHALPHLNPLPDRERVFSRPFSDRENPGGGAARLSGLLNPQTAMNLSPGAHSVTGSVPVFATQ